MKRVISALLACALAASAAMTSLAATFTDTEQVRSWAETQIEYLVEKGVLNGRGDGTFDPQTSVKRVEFIKMLDETFGLTDKATISYSDVSTDAWYYEYVARAAKQGYLLGYGTQLNPEGYLTRQEAAALLARYLDLDPDNAAPSSTYPDYSSIKVAYRSYVLQATAEGLFNGLDDGNFHPDSYLTRAQAAVILARAAGTIYDSSATGTAAKATSDNGVITRAGVQIDSAAIPGRLIVGEGAKSGTVTLYNCTVGTLVVRGTASVVLSGSTVENLIVDCTDGSTVSVSLSGGSSVSTVTLETPARISTVARTQISSMTVEKDARYSSVSGSGTLSSVTVNASGFTASYVPAKYEIASGLTATFNGTSYYGSSSKVENTGFSAVPTTYASSAQCYLTAKSAVTGTLYYYFTTSASAPTSETFDTYYAASAVKGSFAVSKGYSSDRAIGDVTSIGAYSYVAVMLKDSSGTANAPILVSNKASSGFVSAPVVSTSGSYHYLSLTANASGTVRYYYTDSSAALSESTFNTGYNASANKGTLSVKEGVAANNALMQTTLVSAYPYLAVCLESEDGNTYQPLVVSTSSASVGTGMSTTPTTTLSGSSVQLTLTANGAGMLQYYFTSSSVTPTSAQFDSNLAMVQAALSGTKTVAAGTNNLSLAEWSDVSAYPYLVVRLTSGVNSYEPVVLSTSGVSTNLTGTGFNALPTASVSNGYIYLNLNTSSSTRVYYYLTNSATVSSSSVFTKNYESSIASNLTKKTGGYVTTSGYSQTGLQTILTAAQASDYKYIALMIASSTTSSGSSYWSGSSWGQTTTTSGYTPVVIAVPSSGSTTADSSQIFLAGPSYAIYFATRHQIDMTTNKTGRVYYYYTDDKDNFDAETAVGEILFNSAPANTICGSISVTASRSTAIPVEVSGAYPQYVAIIFVDESNTVYTPVFLTTDGSSASSLTDTGFSTTPTVTRASSAAQATLNYSTTTAGTVYYYFTQNATAPNNSATFLQYYNNTYLSSLRGTVSVGYGSGSATLTTGGSTANYPYVAVMFQTADGGTGGYRKPVLITVNASSTSGSSASAFLTQPTLYGSTLYYTPTMTGTLYYTFTNANTTSGLFSPITTILGSMGSVGGTSSSMTYATLSGMLVNYGGGGSTTVYNTGSQRTLTLTSSTATSYSYVAVWMVPSSGTTMSEPVFLPVSGSSISGGTTGGTTGGTITNGGLTGTTSSSSAFRTTPTVSGTQLSAYAATTGTLYYAYTYTNNSSIWSSMVNAAISAGSYGNLSISNYIANQSAGGSVNVTSTWTATTVNMNANLYGNAYVAVWMASSTMISEPVFISVSNTSGSTGSIFGTGNGFSMNPYAYNGNVYYSVSETGDSSRMRIVLYFFTNATDTSMTASTFQTYYTNAMAKSSVMVQSSSTSSIPVSSYTSSYRYMWLMVTEYTYTQIGSSATQTTSYTPVRVQIS